jgi:heat shock protein HslJ
MKRITSVLILLSALVFFSCEKSEKEDTSDIYGKWEATELMSIESVGYPKDKGFNPLIEFKNDGTHRIKLDANGCFGDFTLRSSKSISISASGCTEMCCDSQFSGKFIQMLPQVKTFEIEGSNLKLNIPGWGWIELVAVK